MYDVDAAGLHAHCGVQNYASNNLFYDSRGLRGGVCDVIEGVITGCTKWPLNNGSYIWPPMALNAEVNIIVATQCSLFGLGSTIVWPNPGSSFPASLLNSSFNRNVYFNMSGVPAIFPPGPDGDSFAQWKTISGCDLNSVIADPCLADPAAGNFSVLPTSPAWKLGWHAIDTSSVGPRGFSSSYGVQYSNSNN